MSGVWVAAGSAVAGGYANYRSSQAQAEAQREAAQQANVPFQMKEPYLEDLYEQGQQAQQEAQAVGTPEAMTQGWQSQQNVAQGLREQGYGQGVQQFGQDLLSGRYMDPRTNPYLQGAMSAATDPIMQRYQRDIMPSISGNVTSAGQYGSSRHGVLEANAMNDLTQNILNTRSQMAYQNYADERQRQMQAPQMIQQGTQMQLTPGALMQDVGQQQYQHEVQDPFVGLNQQAQLLGTGPNQQVAAQPTASPMQSAISGGLGGASTAASIMSAMGSGNQQSSMNTQTGWNQTGSPGYGGYGNNTQWYSGMGQ